MEVRNTGPIPVVVQAAGDAPERPRDPIQDQATAKTIAAASRVDANILRTEDQRRISGIWERTQQFIALSVVAATLAVILLLVFRKDDDTATALAILFGLANLVIGFYFGRTNHTRVGGVAATELEER